MAKHPKRTRQKLLKGVVDEALVVGALAATTLIGGAYDDSVGQRSFLISHHARWGIRDTTALEGPLMVGFAHSDYTDAEVEEFIENQGSWDEGDLIGQEVGKRLIRIVGLFPAIAQDMVLNNGVVIKTKCGWVLNSGDSLRAWAYNLSGAVLTTGSVVVIEGNVWLRPMGT